MKDHHQQHEGEGKEGWNGKQPAVPHGLSLTAKIVICLVLLWFVQFVRSMLPGDAGEAVKQVNSVLGSLVKSWCANLDGATLKHWAVIAAGVMAAAILVWAFSKVAEALERRHKSRFVPATELTEDDVLGAMFDRPKQAEANRSHETVVEPTVGASAPDGRLRQAATVGGKMPAVVPKLHAMEPMSRNEAFVYPAKLHSFFLELISHDWTLEQSVDKATQRRGLAARKALEARASASQEHRALYDAYQRFANGRTGNSGFTIATSAMPMMCTSNERPLLVEDGLQKFFRDLQSHDWFYAQRPEPDRAKGKLERVALETIARRTPQHMALFRAFRAHQYSGGAWGTPQRPAPVLRSDLSATPKAARRSSRTDLGVIEDAQACVVSKGEPPSAQQVVH